MKEISCVCSLSDCLGRSWKWPSLTDSLQSSLLTMPSWLWIRIKLSYYQITCWESITCLHRPWTGVSGLDVRVRWNKLNLLLFVLFCIIQSFYANFKINITRAKFCVNKIKIMVISSFINKKYDFYCVLI